MTALVTRARDFIGSNCATILRANKLALGSVDRHTIAFASSLKALAKLDAIAPVVLEGGVGAEHSMLGPSVVVGAPTVPADHNSVYTSRRHTSVAFRPSLQRRTERLACLQRRLPRELAAERVSNRSSATKVFSSLRSSTSHDKAELDFFNHYSTVRIVYNKNIATSLRARQEEKASAESSE